MNEHFTTQSRELGEFYRDWLAAAESYRHLPYCDSIARNPWYYSGCGLCFNLEKWVRAGHSGTARLGDLQQEMRDQFAAAGLDVTYPFDSGVDDYICPPHRADNAQREAWARAHAAAAPRPRAGDTSGIFE